MADSKIVRQLRYANNNVSNGAQPQARADDAPVRPYGSAQHADAVKARNLSDNAVTPGAPEGPVRGTTAVPPALRGSPNPSNGLTKRPGMIASTPGLGEDATRIRRAQNPSAIAIAVNPEGHTPTAPTQNGARVASAPGTAVNPVVLAQGFTSEQRDLLDMLLDDFIGAHTSVDGAGPDGQRGSGNPELAAAGRETKAALARVPVTQNQSAADLANGSARPKRVERPAGEGNGFNPPGDVKIFAPQQKPFQTSDNPK